MFLIVEKKLFSSTTFLMRVLAPDLVRSGQPGQFVMVRLREGGERIPLTIADFDRKKGIVTLVVKVVGRTTGEMAALPEGGGLQDLIGPLGSPTLIEKRKVVFVGGGLGVAPLFPVLRGFKEAGSGTTTIIGFRSKADCFWLDRFQKYSDHLVVMTEDGSFGEKGTTVDALRKVLSRPSLPNEVLTIGPLGMMQAVAEVTRPLKIKTIASMNPIMVDGIGMCGSCRVTVDGKVLFGCVDGPDMDAHKIDFEELKTRQKRFCVEEESSWKRYQDDCALEKGRVKISAKNRRVKSLNLHRLPMPEAPAESRRNNFGEVNLGYSLGMAQLEAERCLFCKKPLCVPGCPVGIDIPGFIRQIQEGDLEKAYTILKQSNPLPAVCGRVCPQETQCEIRCVVGKKGEPVGIGFLERFVGDWGLEQKTSPGPLEADHPLLSKERVRERSDHAVAVVGSGPAGIACAQDLARAGVAVTIYEALHTAGGVLTYGIPPFRLPRKTIEQEIKTLQELGVRLELNTVIGKIFTITQLMGEKGFSAIFIGTGAGLPKFMGLPGEHLGGIMSANEFLTRVNLMHGYEGADTPVGMGQEVVVIGAGNTALDAARIALRLGARQVSIIYRRTERESPARVEELRHAKEEGVVFRWLTNPIRFYGDERGRVREMECVEMVLGEPDESGRRSPQPKPGSRFRIPVDTVIYALGTVSNPIISRSAPELKTNPRGYLEIDDNGMTSMPGVFAGGDIVTGAATVILALGAGRKAAKGILEYLGLQKQSKEGSHGLTMPAVSPAGG